MSQSAWAPLGHYTSLTGVPAPLELPPGLPCGDLPGSLPGLPVWPICCNSHLLLNRVWLVPGSALPSFVPETGLWPPWVSISFLYQQQWKPWRDLVPLQFWIL